MFHVSIRTTIYTTFPVWCKLLNFEEIKEVNLDLGLMNAVDWTGQSSREYIGSPKSETSGSRSRPMWVTPHVHPPLVRRSHIYSLTEACRQ